MATLGATDDHVDSMALLVGKSCGEGPRLEQGGRAVALEYGEEISHRFVRAATRLLRG